MFFKKLLPLAVVPLMCLSSIADAGVAKNPGSAVSKNNNNVAAQQAAMRAALQRAKMQAALNAARKRPGGR
jgi:hypothetical protein